MQTVDELKQAEAAILAGGLFGYRFQFPAARVGRYEVYCTAWSAPTSPERVRHACSRMHRWGC